MNLRSINLNLTPVLWALLRERSVSRAATALGLSQPATSKALAQLRTLLDDALLVRTGRGWILTRRAEALLPQVTALCLELEAVWGPEEFDPAASDRQFVLAATDYCALLLAPRMEKVLARQAPGMSLRFVDLLPDMALSGPTPVDLVIAPTDVIPAHLKEAGTVRPLLVEELVTIMSENHKFADKGNLTPDDLSAERRIIFGYRDPFTTRRIEQGEIGNPLTGPASLVVPQFVTLLLLCALTDAVATVPRRVAEMLRGMLPLRIVEGKTPGFKVELSMAWARQFSGDAEHRWFREQALDQLTLDA